MEDRLTFRHKILFLLLAPLLAFSTNALAVTCQEEEIKEFADQAYDNLRFKSGVLQGAAKVALDTSLRKKREADELLLGAGLKIPKQILVEVCEHYCRSIYRYDHNMLRFVVVSLDDENWTKKFSDPDDRVSGPTFIHEYAHGAFWESMVDFQLPFLELRSQGEKFYCAEKVEGTRETYVKLRQEKELALFTSSDKSLYLYAIHSITVPYTELYSDLVAALIYDSPGVMNVPVNAYTEPDAEAKNRDFSLVPVLREGTLNPHEVLMEVRHEIWKIGWPRDHQSKILVLRKVFAVFKQDIEERWRDGRLEEDRRSLNNRLIAKVRQTFAN